MKAALQLRPFRRLLAAYGVNYLGTWLGEIALAVLVLRETGSAAAVAAVWVVGLFLPSLLGPFVVTRLERLQPTVVLPALLAAQAVLFAGLTAIAATAFSLPAILVLAIADGVIGLVARALLKAAIVASTEPSGLLREGNAVLTNVFTACTAAGPLVGGLVVGLASPAAALALDSASFLLAGLLLGTGPRLPAFGAGDAPAAGPLREGLAYVRARAGLRPLLIATGAISVLGAAILPLEVVLVVDVLHADESAYGIVLALWGAGAVAGSALLPLLRRVSLRALVVSSFALYAASYLGMGAAGSVELVCAFSILGGIANGVEVYATMTAVQELTTEDQQARVGAFFESIVGGATGAGYLVGGALATLASTRAVYVAAGLGILAVALLLAAPRRPAFRARSPLRAIPLRTG